MSNKIRLECNNCKAIVTTNSNKIPKRCICGHKYFTRLSSEYDESHEELLKNPDLFELINEQLSKKIQGEIKSRKAIFLSLCSIWVKDQEIPLNLFVTSESSAGKSFICKRIVDIFPQEIVQYRTKITPEVFAYWHAYEDNWTWDGKICFLEDVSQSILDSPTFKVMCSEGSTASVLIKQKVVDIDIKGKPCMLVTSARTNPTTEVLNRFGIIPLDESKKQTHDIIFLQAEQSAGKLIIDYDKKFSEAFRILETKKVNIPYAVLIAKYLTDNFNIDSLRIRRDFYRLLGLIKASAVIHQFQRKVLDNETIEATPQDYEIARECINYYHSHTFLSLTHRLAKAYNCCIELKEFTAKEIFSKFPFINQKNWYIYLDKLLERGLLKTELRDVEGVKQKVTFYICQSKASFQLPSFDELPTIVTKETKETKVTKVTKDRKKNRTIVTNVTNVVEKPKIEVIKITDEDIK